MALTGIVKTYDPETFTGTIESDGMSFILKRHSFRKGAVLKVGDAVLFSYANLLAGPTAHNVLPLSDSPK